MRRKGCFSETLLQKLRDRELRGGVSGGSVVRGRQGGGAKRKTRAKGRSLCVDILGEA